jgi:rRNA processing protein Gar1
MKRVGRIIQYTRGGKYVIEAEGKILPQTLLYDPSGRRLAVTIDLIGPVNRPFIVAKPLIESAEGIVNAPIYVRMERKRRRKESR